MGSRAGRRSLERHFVALVAIVLSLSIASTAHADSDAETAQQRVLWEFAQESGRDPAELEALLRAAGVPKDAKLQLGEMSLVEMP